jgi:hypothetical protein
MTRYRIIKDAQALVARLERVSDSVLSLFGVDDLALFIVRDN